MARRVPFALVSDVLRALYEGRRDDAQDAAAQAEELDVFEAAALGRAERVRELVDAQPQLARAYTGDGFTPLHLAAFFGGVDAVRVLLEHGAEVDALSRNEQFAPDATPLHSAAAARQVEIARLLLDAGAAPNARQRSGHTPLDAAEANGDVELAALLRERGAA
jgi:ankyrin repeat protein